MRKQIIEIIQAFIDEYKENENVQTQWGQPLVGFADARHEDIYNLKEIITEEHGLPEDVIDDASIVISYFIPFTKELAATNRKSKDIASPEWARAYEETNLLLSRINEHLAATLRDMGYNADISPKATFFDKDKLISHWSQRHFARLAGLGTFGVNNMLITKSGCCGRYSSVVTNLDIEPDKPIEEDYCLYKKNGTCGVCVKNCPSGALTLDGFDRHKCYEICEKNAAIYTEFGSSYSGNDDDNDLASEDFSLDNSGAKISNNSDTKSGSEVCGKCVVGAPCTFL